MNDILETLILNCFKLFQSSKYTDDCIQKMMKSLLFQKIESNDNFLDENLKNEKKNEKH